MNYQKLNLSLMNALRKTYYRSPITDYSFFLQGEHKLLNHMYICGRDHVRPTELCHELNMTSARVSAALKILERKGFILRKFSATDKRMVLVSLTDSGTIYIETVRKNMFTSMENFLMRMGNDAEEFVALMERVSEIIEKTEGELNNENEYE